MYLKNHTSNNRDHRYCFDENKLLYMIYWMDGPKIAESVFTVGPEEVLCKISA